mmetsp:Transcript_48944/g.153705  ORF Transcript_48944/g.153705 Transcript_48944/m.153705 type:complete len:251 (+) Transcript_48944:1645-2397(+)
MLDVRERMQGTSVLRRDGRDDIDLMPYALRSHFARVVGQFHNTRVEGPVLGHDRIHLDRLERVTEDLSLRQRVSALLYIQEQLSPLISSPSPNHLVQVRVAPPHHLTQLEHQDLVLSLEGASDVLPIRDVHREEVIDLDVDGVLQRRLLPCPPPQAVTVLVVVRPPAQCCRDHHLSALVHHRPLPPAVPAPQHILPSLVPEERSVQAGGYPVPCYDVHRYPPIRIVDDAAPILLDVGQELTTGVKPPGPP